jgi:hypothetical protein
MQNTDPVITYDHMKEEPSLSNKYFRKSLSFKNQQVLLFFVEEVLIVSLLAAMIYFVVL